jgi:hypothetical protein
VGLQDEAIEILYAKFVENLTLAEIAKDQGYTSLWAAKRYLDKVLGLLKSMDFKMKGTE